MSPMRNEASTATSETSPTVPYAKQRNWVWLLPWLALNVSGSHSVHRMDLRWQWGVALALGWGAGALWQVLRPRDLVERLLPLAWLIPVGLAMGIVSGPYEETFGARGICAVSIVAGLIACEDLQRRAAHRR